MDLGRRSLLAGGAALLVSGSALAESAAGGETAADALSAACATTAQESKSVMLVFFASWCGYCRLLDAALTEPSVARILEPHFRIQHMRALERDEKQQAQQLEGSDDVYLRYAGKKDAGLPFIAVLDGEQRAVATSASGGVNFGFPVTAGELDDFERMLAAGAPGLSKQDAAAIRKVCARIGRRSGA